LKVTDPRSEVISLISLEKSHVNLSPPIIFLFGGDVKANPHCVRGLMQNYALINDTNLSKQFITPDTFKDWLNDAIYPNLLSFESDLAETASLIVIALESPGALAELGSFSVNKSLVNKLIIIMNDEHYNQESFIKLGPLRQISENNIYSYPYDYSKLTSTMKSEHFEDIFLNINNEILTLNDTEAFDKGNNGHVAFLIYELVSIFQALKLTEITTYLKELGIPFNAENNFSQSTVKRLLFLLEKLEYTSSRKRGKTIFYVATKNSTKVSLSYGPTKRFSKADIIIETAQYYSVSESEKMRKAVIKDMIIDREEIL